MKSFILKLYMRALLRFAAVMFLGVPFALGVKNPISKIFLIIAVMALAAYTCLLIFQVLRCGRKDIDFYLGYSQYSEAELDDEYKHAVKMGPVKMGMMHIYYLTSTSAKIIPISEITKISMSEHRRGRYNRKYYIMNISSLMSATSDRLSFNSRTTADNVVATLRLRNPDFEYVSLNFPSMF